MKARNRKSRWLLIGLLFGILATTGLFLTHRHGVRFITIASQPVPSKHTIVQQLHAALVAATSGKQTLTPRVVAPSAHEVVDSAYSNYPQNHTSDHSDSSSNAPTASGAVPPAVGGTNDAPQQNKHPATSTTGPTAPQDGQYAYNGYMPLDCGLPAGCGVGVGNTGYVTHQPSETVGTVPVAHNSQGSSPPNDGPNGSGPGSDPPGPGPNPSVTAAPELDPATLAAAITLLLGSLAVLRGRRVRPSRATRSRVTR